MSWESKVTATEITIALPHHVSGKKFDGYLARIARIIDEQGLLLEKVDGYRFMIGTSNNWWLDTIDQPPRLLLAYRYGDINFMTQLRAVIIKLLHLEPYNTEH